MTSEQHTQTEHIMWFDGATQVLTYTLGKHELLMHNSVKNSNPCTYIKWQLVELVLENWLLNCQTRKTESVSISKSKRDKVKFS